MAYLDRDGDLFADQAHFIVPDLRGMATETGDANGSLEQFADDLAALVDHLRLQHFTLVGHSMGGYISWSLWRST